MPYRYAWFVIAMLMATSVFAFWRSYFGMLSVAPAGFHLHGLTASLWMSLLLAQSWTANRGHIAVHRMLGRTTFVALPLFASGSMGVIHSMAVGTASGDPFYRLWGAPLAIIDILAFGAVLYAAGMALRHRRNLQLHAGYMLSTALPLVSPVLGRVINRTVPGLTINGPQDFPVFGWGVQIANLMAGLIALWLWRRSPRVGHPWAIGLGVIVVQIIGFQVLTRSDLAQTIYMSLAATPLAILLAFGLAAGAATMYAGWTSPAERPARKRANA